MRVLVTGIAGDIGNGIGRILKEHDSVEFLLGCDIHGEHAGKRIFDDCEIVPRASSDGYIGALRRLKDKARLDAIIPTSEPELRLFSRLADGVEVDDLPVVMANRRAMAIGFDKLETAQFIAGLEAPSPWTYSVSDRDPLGYPCILKSRYGAGNQGVYVVDNPALAGAYRALFPEAIWQEYIHGDNDEYTCGVYGCANGEIRTVIFRRRLVSGVTAYAELVQNEAIESLCATVARALDLRGSINIQLRLGSRGPMIFEINPRFSSTVVFRHRLGFSDLLWSLQEQILGKQMPYSLSYPIGTKAYRVFSEVIEP